MNTVDLDGWLRESHPAPVWEPGRPTLLDCPRHAYRSGREIDPDKPREFYDREDLDDEDDAVEVDPGLRRHRERVYA